MSNVMGQTSVRWNHVSMILSSCFLSTSCSPVNLCYLYVLLHAIAIYILCSLLLSAPLFQEPCKTTSLNSGIILLSCSTLSFPTVWPPSSPDPVRYFYHNKSLIMIFFLSPAFPSLVLCCRTVTNKMWHLRKTYRFRKKDEVEEIKKKYISRKNTFKF